MQSYPAFRFHHPQPGAPALEPRKVHTAEEDEALMASGQWGNQPAGNPEAPLPGDGPILHPNTPKPVDTGLRFPAFRFHPNGNTVKVASPAEDEALKAESADWQGAPCDAATIAAYKARIEGAPTPAAPAVVTGMGEAGQSDPPAPLTPPTPGEDAGSGANTLTAEQSIAAAKKASAEDLAALEKAEKARQSPRVTVLNAIEARYAELAEAQVH